MGPSSHLKAIQGVLNGVEPTIYAPRHAIIRPAFWTHDCYFQLVICPDRMRRNGQLSVKIGFDSVELKQPQKGSNTTYRNVANHHHHHHLQRHHQHRRSLESLARAVRQSPVDWLLSFNGPRAEHRAASCDQIAGA